MEDKKICWKCQGVIDRGDKYCKFCGKKQNEGAKFIYTVIGVIFMFFIIGPFCLLNLWNSPIIEKKIKIILSIIILFITYILLKSVFYGMSVIFDSYTGVLDL